MPRIAATIVASVLIVCSIAFNILQYPLVWDMAGVAPDGLRVGSSSTVGAGTSSVNSALSPSLEPQPTSLHEHSCAKPEAPNDSAGLWGILPPRSSTSTNSTEGETGHGGYDGYVAGAADGGECDAVAGTDRGYASYDAGYDDHETFDGSSIDAVDNPSNADTADSAPGRDEASRPDESPEEDQEYASDAPHPEHSDDHPAQEGVVSSSSEGNSPITGDPQVNSAEADRWGAEEETLAGNGTSATEVEASKKYGTNFDSDDLLTTTTSRRMVAVAPRPEISPSTLDTDGAHSVLRLPPVAPNSGDQRRISLPDDAESVYPNTGVR